MAPSYEIEIVLQIPCYFKKLIYNTKEFKNTEYYDELNAAFKIPTWYGVEFKAYEDLSV